MLSDCSQRCWLSWARPCRKGLRMIRICFISMITVLDSVSRRVRKNFQRSQGVVLTVVKLRRLIFLYCTRHIETDWAFLKDINKAHRDQKSGELYNPQSRFLASLMPYNYYRQSILCVREEIWRILIQSIWKRVSESKADRVILSPQVSRSVTVRHPPITSGFKVDIAAEEQL